MTANDSPEFESSPDEPSEVLSGSSEYEVACIRLSDEWYGVLTKHLMRQFRTQVNLSSNMWIFESGENEKAALAAEAIEAVRRGDAEKYGHLFVISMDLDQPTDDPAVTEATPIILVFSAHLDQTEVEERQLALASDANNRLAVQGDPMRLQGTY
ncbi:MAG: hypothetical protein JWL85_760 [Candidatus Saccharibacteria bacterium]|nr:hypothetical protein [Candidatus Saccharibacteria bacterium]